jgi:hypothetical protein
MVIMQIGCRSIKARDTDGDASPMMLAISVHVAL